ncbi:MAG TPA: hypothetical protein VL053_00220 [Arachidicoccus sp.]|nr:hypothetical protein [Arachidicoccus sp.]
MKKLIPSLSIRLIVSFMLLFTTRSLQAQTGIGTTTPDASAQLDVVSTNKGMLVPRVTTAQRGAISSPADGLLVYDSDKKAFWFFKAGTGWQTMSGNGLTVPFQATENTPSILMSLTNSGSGSAIYGYSAAGTGIHGVTSTGAAASILGDNQGGGVAISGITNSNNAGSVVGRNDGAGYGVHGYIVTNKSNSAVAVLGQVGVNGSTGHAARFENTNKLNKSNTVEIRNNGAGTIGDKGIGNALDIIIDNENSTGAGVKSKINSKYSGIGGIASIYGESSGTGGTAGIFYQSNPLGIGSTVIVQSNGSGLALDVTTIKGTGMRSYSYGGGASIIGLAAGTGIAGLFQSLDASNTKPVLQVERRASTGNIAIFKGGTTLTNKARIDVTGKGFFNGGTQSSGADLAEAFNTTEPVTQYEPGDVLAIDPLKDRTVGKSTNAYSNMVLGVYATKPGVLLTEDGIDENGLDKVPMGVVGVIPTKVCLEGGVIQRGDLLVTSSIPGVAMKADPDKVKLGQVLGKALQNFDKPGIEKIQIFVNIK